MENCKRCFNRITRNAQRYNNMVSTDGLTAQESHALRVISFHQQISQQQLADHLGVDKSQVTRLVHRLEREGYLTRTVNREDRRERLIASTPKADAVRAQDHVLTDRYYQWLLSALSPREQEQFAATLQTLADRASAARKNNFAEVEDFKCD